MNKFYRYTLMIILLLSGSLSFATSVSTKEVHNQRQELVQAVLRFHQWANSVYGEPIVQSNTKAELRTNLEKIFNKNITHWLNGDMVATSIDDLYRRFSILGTKYDSVMVMLPYDEISVDTAAKKVTIRYRIAFRMKDGHEKTIHALSIFRVENNRLSEFNEVSTTKLDHLQA